MSSSSVRAQSDPMVKLFQNARARCLREILKLTGGNVNLARKKEASIYAKAHSSVTLYRDTSVGFIRRLRAGASELWPSIPVHRDASSSQNFARGGVSNAELSALFKINWDDIISEEGRFALAQCPKCRSREIYTVQAQLRSADEGMSVLATCERCGEQWTQR